MPTITLHPPPARDVAASSYTAPPSLPQILQTPSGLALVEIQGTVNASAVTEAVEASSPLPIGKLYFPLYAPANPDDTVWHKRVHLYVGQHQRLTGELKKLRTPFAILRRRQPSAATTADKDELEVAEIVYYQLLFAHRPEPVGSNSL